jgi:hypothetical protein
VSLKVPRGAGLKAMRTAVTTMGSRGDQPHETQPHETQPHETQPPDTDSPETPEPPAFASDR